jgi:hypothetical protein
MVEPARPICQWQSSRDKPQPNADGSTDLYFGTKAPAGKEANWMEAVPGKGYFAILRLYSPTEPAINRVGSRAISNR